MVELLCFVFHQKFLSCKPKKCSFTKQSVIDRLRYESIISFSIKLIIFRTMSLTAIAHWENSSVTQTIPEPTLLSLGGWPREKSPPPPPPPTLGHTVSPVLSRLSGHLDPIVLKPFNLAQVCHGNKICPKLALTWKLTLELTFPAHCISNWKLNGISRTNISKVSKLHQMPPMSAPTDPPLGQELG